MGKFAGKVALVTGGNSGLGKATAEAFAREGAKVVITARREDLGREVEASIRAAGGEATFIRGDITEEEQVSSIIDRIVQTYGRLDCAYNNAWAQPKPVPIANLTPAECDKHFASLRGLLMCMKHEIIVMSKMGGGAIVNCSTAGTKKALPGFGPYGMAKAGVELATRIAAQECSSQNIRVNTILLGAFLTPMSREFTSGLPPEHLEAFKALIPLKRFGELDEVAQAVLFLCSDGAAYTTGATLSVDGGSSL